MGISHYLATFSSIGSVVSFQLYQSKAAECESIAFSLGQEIEKLTDEISTKNQELDNFTKSSKHFKDDFEAQQRDRLTSLNKKTEELSNTKKELESQIKYLKEETSKQLKVIEDYDNSIKKLQTDYNKSESERENLAKKFNFDLNVKIETLITERDQTINDLQSSIQRLQSQLDNVKTDLLSQVDEERSKQADLRAKLEDEQKRALEKQEELSKKVISHGNIDKMESEIAELNKLRTEESKDFSDKINSYEVEVESLKNTNYKHLDLLSSKSQELSDKVKEFNQQKIQLEEANKKIQETTEKSNNKVDELTKNLSLSHDEIEALKQSFASKKHDFDIYDIVRFKILWFYNKIEELIPEVKEVPVLDEEFELDIEHETSGSEGDEKDGITQIEQKNEEKNEEKEKLDEGEVQEKESEEKPGKTITKGNQETKYLDQVLIAVSDKLKIIDNLKEKLDNSNGRFGDFEAVSNNLKHTIEEKTQEIKKLEQVINDHENTHKLNETKLKLGLEEKQQLENKVKEIIAETHDDRKRLSDLKSDMEVLKQTNEELEKRHRIDDKRAIEDDTTKTKLSTKIQELQQSKVDDNNTIQELKYQLTQSQAQNQDLQEKINYFTQIGKMLQSEPKHSTTVPASDMEHHQNPNPNPNPSPNPNPNPNQRELIES